MKMTTARLVAVAAIALATLAQTASATTISDFSNFAFSGTYENWNTGVFTSNPTDFRVEANDFGGMWKNGFPAIDASGNQYIQVKASIDNAPAANKFNVVLFDSDPTPSQLRFEFVNVPNGPDQTLLLPLSAGVVAAAGTTAGLDYSAISEFHVQGTFSNGNPGAAMDMTLDDLSLVVPEPATVALFGLAMVLGGITLRRRQG